MCIPFIPYARFNEAFKVYGLIIVNNLIVTSLFDFATKSCLVLPDRYSLLPHEIINQ